MMKADLSDAIFVDSGYFGVEMLPCRQLFELAKLVRGAGLRRFDFRHQRL
jgi:hypothetical protein